MVGYPDEEIERGEAEVKAIAFACRAGGRAEHVLYAGYGGGVYLPSVGGGEEEGKGKEVVEGHDCWSWRRSWGQLQEGGLLSPWGLVDGRRVRSEPVVSV